ncbi:hypothetical protein [Xanthomonas hortorum]|uniref:hypothetical protein n=2 Tax=Xanthomonas TaxID=338 RepID=UPI0015D57C1D|nr:hypothetical protein [Xanthomonas hortorum]MCE4304304.1 hypothetical protein [Xanthomonas hortorum pv. vitians]MDT7822566.1 hypothetical protein [Xanthomonas hortorum pv. vitians]NMI29032.1 hypothetical protein [Xanthomonas hortorum pv. vitians]
MTDVVMPISIKEYDIRRLLNPKDVASLDGIKLWLHAVSLGNRSSTADDVDLITSVPWHTAQTEQKELCVPIYMVSFECKSSDKDYTGFFSKIKEIGHPWSNDVGSTWLIGHLGNASTIRDALKLHLDKEDRLLVAKLAKKDAAWSGFSTMSSEWLMRHLS